MARERKKKPLRVAVVGCGRISPLHLRTAKEAPEARLVACCDVNKDRARAAASEFGCRAYTDFRRMIRRARPQVVHICLPHYLHTVVANYCFTKKIHVISEKPMALSMADAESTVRHAALTRRQYGVIFQCRYNTPITFVKRALTEGRLGRILSVRSVLTWNRPNSYYTESDWKGTFEKEGGGVLIDQAIHSVDLVRWLVDSEPKEVSCKMSNRGHEGIEVEDTAEGLIVFENGVRCGFYYMLNYETDAPIEITLACERGTAVLSYDSAKITYADGTVEVAHEGEGDSDADHAYWGSRHACQIRQFYRACLGEEPLDISGEAVLATHRLIFALYEDALARGLDLYWKKSEENTPPTATEEKIWYY